MTSYTKKLSSFFKKFITKYSLILIQPLILAILLTKVGSCKTFWSPLVVMPFKMSEDILQSHNDCFVRCLILLLCLCARKYHKWLCYLLDVACFCAKLLSFLCWYSVFKLCYVVVFAVIIGRMQCCLSTCSCRFCTDVTRSVSFKFTNNQLERHYCWRGNQVSSDSNCENLIAVDI